MYRPMRSFQMMKSHSVPTPVLRSHMYPRTPSYTSWPQLGHVPDRRLRLA